MKSMKAMKGNGMMLRVSLVAEVGNRARLEGAWLTTR